MVSNFTADLYDKAVTGDDAHLKAAVVHLNVMTLQQD